MNKASPSPEGLFLWTAVLTIPSYCPYLSMENNNTSAIDDTVKLKELESDDYTYINEAEGLKDVVDFYAPKKKVKALYMFKGDYITGAVVKVGDGDYDEIWLTTDAAPYHLQSDYTRVR